MTEGVFDGSLSPKDSWRSRIEPSASVPSATPYRLIDPRKGGPRLDARRAEEDLPGPARFGREIVRGLLEEEDKEENLLPPEYEGPEKLIEKAFEEVDERLRALPAGDGKGVLWQAKAREWAKNFKEGTEERGIMDDQEGFWKILTMNRFDSLASLKEINLEAWEEMLTLASQRQLAAIVLAARWVRSLPEEVFDKEDCSKGELLFLLRSAGILGKYVDTAFLRQTENSRMPGASEETRRGAEPGMAYIFELSGEGGGVLPGYRVSPERLLSFREMFPYEFPAIEKRLSFLAKMARDELESGNLGERNSGLPAYLELLANAYGCKKTKPEEQSEVWENVFLAQKELIESGCRLVFQPQFSRYVGPANKVDPEMRIGLIDSGEGGLLSERLGLAVAKVIKDKKTGEKPPFGFSCREPIAFGGNLSGKTMAETRKWSIAVESRRTGKMAEKDELPLLEKVLGSEAIGDKEEYVEWAEIETKTHELGHAAKDIEENKEALEKVGTGEASLILGEAQGECVGALVIKTMKEMMTEKGVAWTAEDDYRWLLNKLGANLCYLEKEDPTTDEGRPYFLTGFMVLRTLFESRAIELTGEGENPPLRIVNAGKGLEALAALGERILDLEVSEETNPEKVEEWVGNELAGREGDKVEKLLKFLGKELKAEVKEKFFHSQEAGEVGSREVDRRFLI